MPSPADDPGLIASARGVRDALVGLAHDTLHLAELETRRNGERVVAMIALAVAAALLAVGAWLTLLGALVALLLRAGLPLLPALLGASLLNLALAAWAGFRSRALVHAIGWPATRRALAPREAGPGDDTPVPEGEDHEAS